MIKNFSLPIVLILFLSFANQVKADADLFKIETVNESRQRHSAENYNYYRQNGVPLNGYPEKLNDPAPKGTEYPGYNNYGYGSNSSKSNTSNYGW